MQRQAFTFHAHAAQHTSNAHTFYARVYQNKESMSAFSRLVLRDDEKHIELEYWSISTPPLNVSWAHVFWSIAIGNAAET